MFISKKCILGPRTISLTTFIIVWFSFTTLVLLNCTYNREQQLPEAENIWQYSEKIRTSSAKSQIRNSPVYPSKRRFQHENCYHGTISTGPKQMRYSRAELHRWELAELVRENSNRPGEMGRAVRLQPEDEAKQKKLFEMNQFNLMVSDMIALNRSLKDVRAVGCKSKKYPELLPQTSIVIIFYNEARSTLLRTVWSIINRSPRTLVKEIILVDDGSEQDHLKQDLEDYVATLPVPTQVFRAEKRSGLIRARLLGAKHAKAEVITFLDAHCECTEGWLEPLLARITEDRRTVVCPIIDVIDYSTFEYMPGNEMLLGAFDTHLRFQWQIMSRREMDRRKGDRTAPIRSPTMAGGLFSIDKNYFYELGAYDDGMEIWGGENIEISFRIWQCGGILEIIPCSRVGHVFRDKSPHVIPGGAARVIYLNTARTAEVWTDQWKDFYYAMTPEARWVPIGDVSDRLELRKNLKCKSFRWYLKTVYPESPFPLDYYYAGEIVNVETRECLETMSTTGENLNLRSCKGDSFQAFAYTTLGQIMSDNKCLDATRLQDPIKMLLCHRMGGNQTWRYNRNMKTITHVATGHCLSTLRFDDSTQPILAECDPRNVNQKWLMRF